MYARYIPPPKGSRPSAPKPEVEASFPPASATTATIASPAVSSATPYSRYVPPPRAAHNPAATPTPAPRAPLPSKTHLNAAAIPPPESLPPKIVFNYDADEPSPSKKRKLDSPEPVPESKEKKSKKEKRATAGDPNAKKEKKKDKKKDKNADVTAGPQSEDEEGTIREKRKRKKEKAEKESFAFGFDPDAVGSEDAQKDVKQGQDDEVLPDSHSPLAAKAESGADDLTNEANVGDSGVKKEKKKKRDKDEVPARHKAVLEKAAKSIKEAHKLQVEDAAEPKSDDEAEPVEAHGLVPLPQPEPVAQDLSKPAYETLPAWIANPVRVASSTKAPFTDLGISKDATAKLLAKGYASAFAVQTAVIPLLLPSPDRQGDVVVSAATGSGKTLAYVLPMVRDISQGIVTRLRGVIVVPTRELVLQAKEVCETCSSVFSGPGRKTVRIGISMGNKQFDQEQADLVEEDQRFDPEGHQKWLQGHIDQDLDTSLFDDAPRPLPNHVIDYSSKVDILVCTPGRLVDHISRTPGFTLDYVRWLVVDEADKLLAQTFQDWLPVVMPLLSNITKPGARDFPDSNKTGVRKVILSATMTRDLTLLNGLKLARPTLVTLEGSFEEEQARESQTEHVLPESLQEAAVKIRDPNLKPLYLVDLLDSTHLAPASEDEDVQMKDTQNEDSSSDEEDSDSESSDSDSSSGESDSESDSSDISTHTPSRSKVDAAAKPFRTTVLIFTKSNETAIRLSRLLSLLSPHLTPLIGTLTSTTRTSQRRKTLRAFAAHKLRILVASDLVARGIDLSNLDHVVNYDMPTSVASYVHRVGRTARAGRNGRSWTFFTKNEAGWFWTAVAGKGESKSKSGGHILRNGRVEEVRIEDRWEEERLSRFDSALETLGKEASEMRRRR